jgi:hypothetical protein
MVLDALVCNKDEVKNLKIEEEDSEGWREKAF